MPLWAAETRIAGIRNASQSSSTTAETQTTATSAPLPLPDPKQDAARMAALKKLRHKFVQLCSEHGDRSKPPVLAFERWLGRAALRRTPRDDPIVPSDVFGNDGMLVVDNGFAKDISRTLPSWEASNLVAKEMTKEASKQIRSMAALRDDEALGTKDLGALRTKIRDNGRAVKEATKCVTEALKDRVEKEDNPDRVALLAALASLQRATTALNESATKTQRAVGSGNSSNGGGNVVFNGSRREGIYDVMLCGPNGKPRRPYLTVSSLHLSKLLRLWRLNSTATSDKRIEIAEDGDPIETMNALDEDDRTLFQKSLYCCLARYEALKGAGYQCAVPGIAFDAAANCGLGTTIECFASPLNCRYERFCSAFPDIEMRFGSLGSFFDDTAFDPLEGSFEANPPFVPETMIAMGEKLERLLGDTNRGPLSFLVVIPSWGAGIDFVKNLEASVHVRASSRVQASDHAFCDGAQHTKPLLSKKNKDAADPDLRPSSWDTAVILLQNDAGASKWNVDGAKLEESFCNALKASIQKVSKKFATLGDWERRGVGQGGTKNRQNHGKSHPSNGNKRPFARDDKIRNDDQKRPKR